MLTMRPLALSRVCRIVFSCTTSLLRSSCFSRSDCSAADFLAPVWFAGFYRFLVACGTLGRKLRIHLCAFGLCFCFVRCTLGRKLRIRSWCAPPVPGLLRCALARRHRHPLVRQQQPRWPLLRGRLKRHVPARDVRPPDSSM